MTYFSEKEKGEIPREHEEIGKGAWGGIEARVQALIADGSFGASYPTTCPDGGGATGSDEDAVWKAIGAEIPNLQFFSVSTPPPTLDILDLIQFCWRYIGKPNQNSYHDFFKHHHLSFNVEEGRAEFQEHINRIFRRNGLAYKLTTYGEIERLAPPILREEMSSVQFSTGDNVLDGLLEKGRTKFLRPDEAIRREALEALWDAWERLKTLDHRSDKRAGIKSLLDGTAGSSSPKFRLALEQEATALTKFGNEFQIRHSETSQEQLIKNEHVDYLFHRLLSLIQVILRTNSRF